METARKREDSQVLSEIVSNERIVEHPTRGKIKFRFPTLQIQRKIDAAARLRKKVLRETVDHIPDSNAPSGHRIVPAYKSRQVLEHEYRESGWWTDEMESKLEELSNLYIGFVTKLEILGFDSIDAVIDELDEIRTKLNKSVEADDEAETTELINSILKLTTPTIEIDSTDTNLIKNCATTTEVDSVLDRADLLRDMYNSYSQMVKIYNEVTKLDQEKNSLFADSWQNQLEYFVKLAQVFYCAETIDPSGPIYKTIEDLEAENDTEFVSWLFMELQALWQGLTDESRERMGKYSFTRRPSSDRSSSEDSDAPAESKADGDLPEKTQLISTEVTDIKESLPQSNLISLNTSPSTIGSEPK